MKLPCWLLVVVCCGSLTSPGCSVKEESFSREALMNSQIRLVQDLQEMDDLTFIGHLENAKNKEQLFELYLRVILGGKVSPEFVNRIERIHLSRCLAANSALGLKILYLCTPEDSDIRRAIRQKWIPQCWQDFEQAEGEREATYVYFGTPQGSEVRRAVIQKLEKIEGRSDG